MSIVGCMFALIYYQKKLERVKRTDEFYTINLEIYQYGCQTKVRSNWIQTTYILPIIIIITFSSDILGEV